MPGLEQGRIIEARVCDPQGRNEKRRPLVVVSESPAVPLEKPFWCIVISGTLPSPLPDDHVLLPWHRDGNSQTKLTKRSAAICTWPVHLTAADVLSERGVVPTKEMSLIKQKVHQSLLV